MDFKSILYRRETRKATITLNRPRAFNALNREMVEELFLAVRLTEKDPDVRVVILTGAGRAFCFGADPLAFDTAGESLQGSPLDLLEKSQDIIRTLAEMPKPVIAALNGFATGLGLDLALACDLRIAAERAKLASAFISMALVPDGGGTFFLPRLMGLARASEMIFTGEPISSREAQRIGLINSVVSNDEFTKAVEDLADKLLVKPSLALGLAKQTIRKNLQQTLESALEVERENQKRCLASAEHREAVQAFLEKRDPAFGKRGGGQTPPQIDKKNF